MTNRLHRINYADTSEDISDPLTFQITNIKADDYTDDDDNSNYRIQIFGLTLAGITVHLIVDDFLPFFYIEVPDEYNELQMKVLLKNIKERLDRRDNEGDNLITTQCKFVKKEKLMGFTNHKKFKFIKMVFKTHKTMKKCSYIFNYSPFNKYTLHEINIEPFMRFFHITNIEPAGWITIKNFDQIDYESSNSTCFIRIDGKYKTIEPSKKDLGLAPIMCCAFDIECTSTDGGFPDPTRPDDECIMIASIFRKYPDTKSFLKVVHTIKKCSKINDKDTVVIECETEEGLLLKWRKMIQTMDPDYIYGYNSNGFDWAYIHERAKRYDSYSKFMKMSRNKDEICEYKEKKLSSSAMGDNIHKFIEMNGRIIIDVMKEVQKNHKLDMYKLDFVAEHFLESNKVDLSPQQLFANYKKGTPKLIKEIAVYCIQDTELCNDLVWKLNFIINAMKMANVCSVPAEYLFYRGQGVKIFSLVSKECRNAGIIVPVIKKPYNLSQAEEEKRKEEARYEGATVLDTDGGLYYEPVVVLDFNSLYPNCMKGWNISHDTIVLDSRYDNLPNLKYDDISYVDYDGETTTCRFVQTDDGDKNKGIFPIILDKLLSTRKSYKTEMKKVAEETFQWLLLNGSQLAYKVVANSCYGQCGATTSPIYFKKIAACTTAKGRELLKIAKTAGENSPYNVECIYGDTDSNFYLCKGLEGKSDLEKVIAAMEIGIALSVIINKVIGKPNIINFAYEKVLFPLLLLTKKRYFGILFGNDPKVGIQIVMGLALKRRDTCPFAKNVMQGVLDRIADKQTVGILKFIEKMNKQLIADQVEYDQLRMSQTLKAEYKQAPAHKYLADRMRARGETVNSNDRIAYIFAMHPPVYNTRGTPVKKQVKDIIEEISYAKEQGISYDPEEYIERQIRTPVEQILKHIVDDPKKIFDDAILMIREKKYEKYGQPVKALTKKQKEKLEKEGA